MEPLSVVSAVVKFIPDLLRKAWQAIVRHYQLSRPTAAEIGEVLYLGSLPQRPEHHAVGVVCWVAIRNPSGEPNGVASLYLDVPGFVPIYASEHRKSDSGGDILVPKGGGFASVPPKGQWLEPPIGLEKWSAAAGWVGFLFVETPPSYHLRPSSVVGR